MMMAMATAASAAAMAITNTVNITPSNLFAQRYLLKAIKLILTLFRISSMLINMVMRFLLVRNP
jgi:hypothetical protein